MDERDVAREHARLFPRLAVLVPILRHQERAVQRDLRRGPFPAAEPHRSVRDVEDLGVGLQSRPHLGRGFREEKVRPKAVVPGDHRGPFPGAAE